MRKDYWDSAVPLRLPITKAGKKRLERIQRVYFPSFSQSSVVKILFGIFAKQHGLATTPRQAKTTFPPEARANAECVELSDYSEDDLDLIRASIQTLAKNGGRSSPEKLLASVVDSFWKNSHVEYSSSRV